MRIWHRQGVVERLQSHASGKNVNSAKSKFLAINRRLASLGAQHQSVSTWSLFATILVSILFSSASSLCGEEVLVDFFEDDLRYERRSEKTA